MKKQGKKKPAEAFAKDAERKGKCAFGHKELGKELSNKEGQQA